MRSSVKLLNTDALKMQNKYSHKCFRAGWQQNVHSFAQNWFWSILIGNILWCTQSPHKYNLNFMYSFYSFWYIIPNQTYMSEYSRNLLVSICEKKILRIGFQIYALTFRIQCIADSAAFHLAHELHFLQKK